MRDIVNGVRSGVNQISVLNMFVISITVNGSAFIDLVRKVCEIT